MRRKVETVWLLCCGGSNYCADFPEDAAKFDTLADARRHLKSFFKWHLAHDVSWHVYFGEKPDGQGYPDRIASLGPNGGIRIDPA